MTNQRNRLATVLHDALVDWPIGGCGSVADALLARGVRVVDVETLAAALHERYEAVHYTDTDPDYGHKGRCRACGEDGVWSADVDAAVVVAALDAEP